MTILQDERDILKNGQCENCGGLHPGRKIEAVGFSGESRGWYFIYVLCFEPRITWKPPGKHSRIYISPTR